MDIVLEQYRTRLQNVKKRAPATLIAFDKAAQKFQRHLDALGKRAVEMEPWDLEEYLASLDLAPNTKYTHWVHIGGAFRYAVTRRMFDRDLTKEVYLAPAPEPQPQTIPNAELRAMKTRIHCDRQWLAYHLLIYTGMRQAEIRALRWGHVDLVAGTLKAEHTKGDRTRYVPIHPVLGEVLAELQQEDPLSWIVTSTGRVPLSYTTWLADLKSFAPGFTAHWFRRSFVSGMLDNGVDYFILQQIIGHKPQTVMGRFYTKPSQRIMQHAILKLYADDPV